MKRLMKLWFAATLLLGIHSCTPSTVTPQEEPEIEVTINNISGSWMLNKWNDALLQSTNYVYIDFDRAKQTYVLYQNIDSSDTRIITGRFNLYLDGSIKKYVLRGEYDHGVGSWNHRYIIDRLTASTMRLAALDDPEEVCDYVRTDIPSDISGK